MAKAMKCDICGKYFDINEGDINYIKKAHKNTCLQFSNESSADACPECVKSIEAHIESLKPTKSEPKTKIKHSCLNFVTYKGCLHFYNRDSLGRDEEECAVTVILNKNGQVNNIFSIVTDDWEYTCEIEATMEDVCSRDGTSYRRKAKQIMWYMRRRNHPYDGWIFCPNIAYLEYEKEPIENE